MPQRPKRFSILVICVGLVATVGAETQPGDPTFTPSRERPYGWRGDGSGCFAGAKNPPVKWDLKSGENVRWRCMIDTARPYKRSAIMTWTLVEEAVDRKTRGIHWFEGSYGSPVLLDDRVVTLSEPNWIVCVGKADGKELWRQQVPFDVMDEELAAWLEKHLALYCIWRVGFTTPTPVTDNTSIWAVFGFGAVARFDREGKRLWTGTFNACGLNRAGTSRGKHLHLNGTLPSPVLCKDPAGDGIDVLVTCGVETDAFVGWNAENGERLWAVPLRGFGHHGPPVCGGTPVKMIVDGKTVVVTGEGWVIEVRNGKVVQKLVEKARRVFPSPVARGDTVVLLGNQPKAWVAYRLADGGTTASKLWTWQPEDGEIHRVRPGSPLWCERGVLVSARARVKGSKDSFRILDPQTGAVRGSLPDTVTGQSSSATLAGDLVYVIGKQANIVRLGAAEPELVASFTSGFRGKPNHHGFGLFNSPVFEGSRMYFRDLKALYCIETADE